MYHEIGTWKVGNNGGRLAGAGGRPSTGGVASPGVLRPLRCRRCPGGLRSGTAGALGDPAPVGRRHRGGGGRRHRGATRCQPRFSPPSGRPRRPWRPRRSRGGGSIHPRRGRHSSPAGPRPHDRRALAGDQRWFHHHPRQHAGCGDRSRRHDPGRLAGRRRRQRCDRRAAATVHRQPAAGAARPRARGGECIMSLGAVGAGADVAIGVAALVVIAVLVALRGMINIVQQGQVGVVKRLGEYRRTHEPGLVVIAPFIDSMQRVDMREIPRTGDRQEVITKDNVVVTVNATIFTQVVDASQALFSVANFDVAIDALARTALRSVIGTLSLDEALSERERINTDVQQQMEVVTDKWGIRISRIEIVEIAPPPQILQALALQKQADQEKRAKILQSEGLQQSAINVAQGNAEAAVKAAEGERQAAILRAQGNREAAILEAQGRAQAIQTVYSAIAQANPDPTLVAILQLDTLAKFADSDNSTVLVPYESAGLLGAAQALRSVLGSVPATNGNSA